MLLLEVLMSKKNTFIVFFILTLTALLISHPEIVKESNIQNDGLIKQVDHILLTPEDPRGLFNFLSQELKMPVVWQYQEYPGFASGGVFAGNVNLEALRFQNEAVNTPSKIAGIAFEPSAPTEELVKVLDHRQIPYAKPQPYEVGPDGSKMKLWTTTIIENILPGSFIFVCEYHMFNPPLMRKNMQKTFKKVDGGPLGIEYVGEIKIKLNERAEDFKKWQNLLKPYRCSQDGCFDLGKGPSLRFLESDKDYIHSLRIKVKSIKKAREYLSAKGLIRSADNHTVATNPDKTFGIIFEFFETRNKLNDKD
jgi:hypothetical protein